MIEIQFEIEGESKKKHTNERHANMEKIDTLESCSAWMQSADVDEEEKDERHAPFDALEVCGAWMQSTDVDEEEKDMLDQFTHVALDDATKTLPVPPDDDVRDFFIRLPSDLQQNRLIDFNNEHAASCFNVAKEPFWGSKVLTSRGPFHERLYDAHDRVKRTVYRTTPVPKRAALREQATPEEVASLDSPRVGKKAEGGLSWGEAS